MLHQLARFRADNSSAVFTHQLGHFPHQIPSRNYFWHKSTRLNTNLDQPPRAVCVSFRCQGQPASKKLIWICVWQIFMSHCVLLCGIARLSDRDCEIEFNSHISTLMGWKMGFCCFPAVKSQLRCSPVFQLFFCLPKRQEIHKSCFVHVFTNLSCRWKSLWFKRE